jgi:hypothetical protein
MKEPRRLLSHGATDFERQLLRAVANERPSAVLRSRMQRGLGLVGPLAWASNVKAMVASVASKLTGGVALSTVVAVAGIAAVSLTPGSDVVAWAAPSTAPGYSAASTGAFGAGASSTAASSTGTSPVESKASAPSEAPAAEPAPPSAEPAQAAVASAAEPSVPALAPPGDGELAASGAPATNGSVEQDDDGRLREEIALLDTARASLQRGDRESARQSLRSYRERFPDGILRREAGLLRRRADSKRARSVER